MAGVARLGDDEVSDVDPVKFGLLIGQVKTLEAQVDDLQRDVKSLLALANKSKGGFWAGMTIASMLGGVVSWVATHMGGK